MEAHQGFRPDNVGDGEETAGCACGAPAPPPPLRYEASPADGGAEEAYEREGASFALGAPPEPSLEALFPFPPEAEALSPLSDFIVGGREQTLPSGVVAEAPRESGALGTTSCECVETLSREKGQPCSTAPVVAAITEFVQEVAPEEKGATSTEAVRGAAKVLGCTSESCVVSHPDFREFVEGETGLAASRLDAELLLRFKPPGPRSSARLLSNYNIDDVLQQWAIAYPTFFNYSFNMIDFETAGGSLAQTDVAGILEGKEPQLLSGGVEVRRCCTTFACALNTDVSTGRGKHWVAIFGDCRGTGPWSLEYFNSAGNPPPVAVTRWLEASGGRLAAHRRAHPRKYGAAPVVANAVTDVRHQDSQTECGLYILFYIRARLEGRPPSEFARARIPDSAMAKFRTHVFREEG